MATQEEINAGALNIRQAIQTALETDSGALIGRNGTIELQQMIKIEPAMLNVL